MSKHTPGPWEVFNMVNEDGSVMSAKQIGEYAEASFTTTVNDGGADDRFLFVSCGIEDKKDICHVGNGPRGPYNARLIAAAPDLLESLLAFTGSATEVNLGGADAVLATCESLEMAKRAIAKATGE